MKLKQVKSVIALQNLNEKDRKPEAVGEVERGGERNP